MYVVSSEIDSSMDSDQVAQVVGPEIMTLGDTVTWNHLRSQGD